MENSNPNLSPNLNASLNAGLNVNAHEPVKEIEINLPEYKGFYIDEPARYLKKRNRK